MRRQPIAGLLFDELDRDYWSAVYCTGPSQSGKTLSCFVIPTLRTVVELGEDAIVGVPEADMAADKWDKDFRPTIDASPDLSWLIPSTGPGAKGGRIKDRITLANGVDIKIFTRGGKDTNKAGYTGRRVFVTEAKGWSGRAESSTEADDLRKLIARMRAFTRSEQRLLVEGTLGEEWELPWTARGSDDPEAPLISTRSEILSPCPHCEAWIAPQRDRLVGWQQARTELEALELATWQCPKCGRGINDDQRRASLADARLVHHGQAIDAKGNLTGEIPPVLTLWFHWRAWHNALVSAGDAAIDEWKASLLEEGTLERDNAERELCQFVHGVTFESKLATTEALNPQQLRKRAGGWGQNLLPGDTEWLTIGVDIGKYTAWWAAVAFRKTGELFVPAYGAFNVCRPGNSDDEATRVVESLGQFAEEVVERGFPVEGSDGARVPDGVLIDIGYLPNSVAAFVRAHGRGLANRYKGGRGRGVSVKRNNGSYSHPKQVTRARPRIGMEWFCEWNFDRHVPEITFNADFWMRHLQDRFRISPGNKGAITLYTPAMPKEHAKIISHVCAEELRRKFDPAKGGEVEKYIRKGDNHLGDALKMALVLGDWFGFKLAEIEGPGPEQDEAEEESGSWWATRAAR